MLPFVSKKKYQEVCNQLKENTASFESQIKELQNENNQERYEWLKAKNDQADKTAKVIVNLKKANDSLAVANKELIEHNQKLALKIKEQQNKICGIGGLKKYIHVLERKLEEFQSKEEKVKKLRPQKNPKVTANLKLKPTKVIK